MAHARSTLRAFTISSRRAKLSAPLGSWLRAGRTGISPASAPLGSRHPRRTDGYLSGVCATRPHAARPPRVHRLEQCSTPPRHPSAPALRLSWGGEFCSARSVDINPWATFDAMDASVGRPSIPPERLLKAQLLMALYTLRSERQLCRSRRASRARHGSRCVGRPQGADDNRHGRRRQGIRHA